MSPSCPAASVARFETSTAVPGPIDGAIGSPAASTASLHPSNCHSPRFNQPPSAPPIRSGTIASTGPAGNVVVAAAVVVVSSDGGGGGGRRRDRRGRRGRCRRRQCRSGVRGQLRRAAGHRDDQRRCDRPARQRDREIIGSAPSPFRRARRARVGAVRRSRPTRSADPPAVGRTRSAGDGVHPRERTFPSGSAGAAPAG